MRKFVRRAITLGAVALTACLWSGCKGKEQTEYVTGISTQVQVPRDLRAVRISVSVGGFTQFCRGYRVYDGKVQLPRSLGTYALNDTKQTITYSIIGYGQDLADGSEFGLEECTDNVGTAGARIVRRSRQPYIPEQILFLPLPLKYACFDTKCENPNETCKGGECVDAAIKPELLPEFDPALVDGSGGACFPASQCFAAAAPAITVDPDTCTYALANSASEPPLAEGAPDPIPGQSSGDGLNVEITWDGGVNREILDLDPTGDKALGAGEEGFSVPDPQKPQQFRLAKGLCDMVKGYKVVNNVEVPTTHRITAIRASGTCQSKSPLQPICAGDQLALMGADANGTVKNPQDLESKVCAATELKPPQAVMMMLVDDTLGHQKFFQDAEGETLGVSLADPAFQRTEIGLMYTPGTASAPDACLTTTNTIAVAPKLARNAKEEIAASFAGKANSLFSGEFSLDAGLARAYGALQADVYKDYFRRAVLVVGNRDFNKDQCIADPAVPVDLATAARGAARSVDTYVVALTYDLTGGKTADEATNPLDPGADQLAQAGGTTSAANARGTGEKGKAKDKLQEIINSLATCVYDVDPAKPPVENGTLTYSDPISGTTGVIPFDGACTGEGAGASGWGFAGGDTKASRIFVCGKPCDDYRGVLSTASNFSILYKKPTPAVPIFAHKPGCGPAAGPVNPPNP